jgi:hypothetical protein
MRLLLIIAHVTMVAELAAAITSINDTNRHAYGANLGWMNWRGDTNSGAVIGEDVCSGYIYSGNVGWIHLGSNVPANQIKYQNNAATDYGVNHDGLGNLRGYAYGANIGWINFETNGNPRVDLKTGALNGHAYSANCGWISLSNTYAHVQTDIIQPGLDSDGDGITDAWELTYTNTLTAFSVSSDADGDGVSDLNEHLADTSPMSADEHLRITAYSAAFGNSDVTNTLTWTSRESRCYRLNSKTNLSGAVSWAEANAIFAPDAGGSTTRMLALPGLASNERYFRVEATKPLTP